jgi:hypothetical protein
MARPGHGPDHGFLPVRFLSRLLSQLVLRLLLTIAFGALLLVMQGRLPLGTGDPGSGGVTAAPGTVDPQAEADRVARTLADLAARLRGGSVYDAAPTAVAGGPADAPTASDPRFADPRFAAPRFTAPPRAPSGDLADTAGTPRILNGGGAGSFHRVPAP